MSGYALKLTFNVEIAHFYIR